MEKLIRQLPEVQQEVVRLTLYDDLKPCSSSSNGAQWELGAVGGIAPSVLRDQVLSVSTGGGQTWAQAEFVDAALVMVPKSDCVRRTAPSESEMSQPIEGSL
jgi:hypothetical protein